ncbi:MAG: hypothetical protein ACFFCP_00450 [Promethearchaeota archaeon]
MSDKKTDLINLIERDNVSAVRILADRLELTPEEVKLLIDELLADGSIQGSITEDGERFFKRDVKLSEAPAIPIDGQTPSFLKFNIRPGIITSIVGFAVIIVGVFLNGLGGSGRDLGAIVIFIGIAILLAGLFWLSLRKTPS